MGIQAIDTKAMRSQSGDQKTKALSGIGFSDYMAASTAPAATAVALNQGYTPAAVTQAAMTGVAGAGPSFNGNAANAPYYSPTLGTASPFGSGGYSYGGAPFSGGYAGAGAGVGGVPGAYGSVGYNTGGAPGAPSQDYMEKQALFQQMNDANWEMLVAQVTVNDLSRDYQARSNILKSKSDAEISTVRNMKA